MHSGIVNCKYMFLTNFYCANFWYTPTVFVWKECLTINALGLAFLSAKVTKNGKKPSNSFFYQNKDIKMVYARHLCENILFIFCSTCSVLYFFLFIYFFFFFFFGGGEVYYIGPI